MSKHFYVYYSYEEFGRGYIGSRGCKCLPEEDSKYYGSFRDKNFNPTQKIILGVYESRKDAYEAEILLHEFYDVARNPHFANRCKALSSGFTVEGVPINKGIKKSEEFRKLISESNKRRIVSDETRKKLSDNQKGRRHSEETKRKVGEASKRRVTSDETRKLKSKQMSGEGNHMYGRTHTPEARERIGAAQRGKTISEEHRQRIIEANKGKKLTEEQKKKLGAWERDETYRKNLSNALKGRSFSEETRKKMSESAKKRRERERLEKLHQAQDTKE